MKRIFLLVLSLGFLFIATPGFGTDYDFQGTFTKDNDLLQFNFSVAQQSTVTVFSSSWLNPSNGTGVPAGGFDPMLGIWTSSGSLIQFQDDGHNVGSTFSNGVSYNHGEWDSYYAVNLAAGNYIATVTEFDNFPNQSYSGGSLSAGFVDDNAPHFTFTKGYGSQPDFNGVWGGTNDPRTNYWQFHLLNVNTAEVIPPGGQVPEPATMLLLGSGLLGLVGYGRRKFRK